MANPEPSRDDSPAALRPGVSFGDYDIVRCIGIGGMGSVFEAVHRLMNRPGAGIAVVRPDGVVGFRSSRATLADIREWLRRTGVPAVGT